MERIWGKRKGKGVAENGGEKEEGKSLVRMSKEEEPIDDQ